MKATADVDAVLAHRHDNGADYWATPDGRIGVGAPFSTLESLVIFYYVYVLSFYEKARRDRRFKEALRALESKLDDHGRVVVERPHRALASFALCAKGKPSERATARYREIRENVG